MLTRNSVRDVDADQDEAVSRVPARSRSISAPTRISRRRVPLVSACK